MEDFERTLFVNAGCTWINLLVNELIS